VTSGHGTLARSLREGAFITRPWGALVYPSHLLRSALYHAIRPLAEQIGGSVLDFGCGSKPYESLFGHAREYVGIDVAQTGHDHTNSKVDVFFDGTAIPFEDQRFDSVVCFEVLEHVPEIDAALAEMARVLKPGGTLLATIPFGFPEHEVPYDFRRLTEYGLRRVFPAAGFEIRELVRTGTNWLTINQLILDYVTVRLLPGRSAFVRGLRVPFAAAINLFAYATNAVLPKHHTLPMSFVVLARKA
jgi:SAM-dependent methyltransferase